MITKHCRSVGQALVLTALGMGWLTLPALAQSIQIAQASGPVVSISQLSDVQPTDWAYLALQSLVERYGCIVGYPDVTYRGNRALSRYEFAAGVNACLDRLNELVAAGLAGKISREDLAVLQRLQEEFAAELAALQGRVDLAEVDVAALQGQVFNPVTKLNVEVRTALTGSTLAEDRQVNGEIVEANDQATMTLPYRMRMAFDASFTGRDRLRIRLEAEDAETDFFSGDPGFDFNGDNDTVELDDLYYQFRTAGDRLFVFAGLNSVDADQVFAYDVPWEEFSNFSDTPKSTQDAIGGSAVGLRYQVSEQASLAYAYTTEEGQTVGEFGGSGGLTGGNTGHYVEFGFVPNDRVGLYLQYGASYVQEFQDLDFLSSVASNGDTFFNYFQGPLSDPSSLENPSTGEPFPMPSARLDAFTFATTWEITPRVVFSGWISFGQVEYDLISAPLGTVDPGDEDVNGWLVGFLFPDLLLEGSEGTIVFGQPITGDGVDLPPYVLDINYVFPVNQFFKIRPGGYLVFNPNGSPSLDNDPTLGVGAIELIFSF